MEVEDIEALEKDLYVQVHVEAEDEDDQVYRWSSQVPCCKPLLPLRAKWAEAHGVREEAVGFEDYLDREVDLQRTPQELGWSSQKPVYLHSVPVDDRFAEGAEGELPARAVKSEGKLQAADSRPAAASAARTDAVAAALAPVPAAKRPKAAPAPAALPAPAAPTAAAAPSSASASGPTVEAPGLESALARRLAAQREKACPPQAPLAAAFERQAAREAAEPSGQAPGSVKFAPLTSCMAPIDLDDDEPDEASESTSAGCSSSSLSSTGSFSSADSSAGLAAALGAAAASAAAATAETAAAPLRKRLRPTMAELGNSPAPGAGAAPKERCRGEAGACPLGSESVSFDARNPKKVGTGAYERYAKYKEAKTPAEALRLGASKGDLMHDFKRGFMRRC